jgi:uncharacterized membrane protein
MHKQETKGDLAKLESDGLTTGRIESFTDSVLAIAITLLVLQLGTSEASGSLAHRLGGEWPLFLSYFISFVNVGTIWLNHHKVISRIDRADHVFLVLNLALLLVVAFLPFPTRLIGEELSGASHADQRTAALMYSGTFLAASVAFYVLWHWAAQDGRLIKPGVPDQLNRVRTFRFVLALPLFAIPCVVAFFAPIAALAADGVIMASFLLSDARTDNVMMRLARVEA